MNLQKFVSKHWSYVDLSYLISRWGILTNKEIAYNLKKTVKAVENKALRIRKEDKSYCPVKNTHAPPNIRAKERLVEFLDNLQKETPSPLRNETTSKKTSEEKMQELKFWTPEETKWLIENWGKKSLMEMATFLKKSESSVVSRVYRLRRGRNGLAKLPFLKKGGLINKEMFPIKPWTNEEHKWLLDNWTKYSVKELAEFLQRSPAAVSVRMSLLRKKQEPIQKPIQTNFESLYQNPPVESPVCTKPSSSMEVNDNSFVSPNNDISMIQEILKTISNKLPSRWSTLSLGQKNLLLKEFVNLMLMCS